ncbi:dihydrofolate reductase family protein [Actinopolymorpha pittospori]|uniref:Dihydrofolate reductase n=1 Tax=Actinopolymorpha pittospori TaxID=648752 RepID=A0A927MPH4_9ACTN|nr:dihydrofolate reductase family protein [Actinopolymorpha pittospori]MBE1604475.1 dihydrofolate reductase [Actinopolymorpha pittospori]
MNRVIVIAFTTLDGVVEDPDGSDGTPGGGWAFRHGPEAVAGDKFRLGSLLDTGGLLLGGGTWQLFAKLWPNRTDDFSQRMNAAQKWVASRTLTDVSAWSNSTLINGDLGAEVKRLREERDVIVIGSPSIAQALIEVDLVEEYRLMVFPTVLGSGRRLFTNPAGAGDLRTVSIEQVGPTALLRYERAR